MPRQTWTRAETQHIIKRKNQGASDAQIAKELNRSFDSTNSKVNRMRIDGELDPVPVIPKSSYPVLKDAPQLEGDFVILSDVEAPFQHSEFINRVIELAHTWGIRRCILAGDFLHFEGISAWGAGWEGDDPNEKLDAIMEFIGGLDPKDKARGNELLEKIGVIGEGGAAQELGHAKRVVKYMTEAFSEITWIMGNHEDRYIRRIDTALSVTNLADLIKAGDTWKVSNYYHCTIQTEAGPFRISHPRTAAKMAAVDLAMQFQSHFLMGHSHRWQAEMDKSGKFWAIQMGHCVDEKRLEYVMHRDAKRDGHALGAVILRGGYPWLLGEKTPWKQMAQM